MVMPSTGTSYKTPKMVSVELVADRENHKDNLYGTETVWIGKGDVKQIPEPLWPKFAQHADVYRLAKNQAAADAPRAPTQEEIAAYIAANSPKTAKAEPAKTIESGQVDIRKAIAAGGLSEEPDADVRALAAEAGLPAPPAKLTGAALRAHVTEAAKAA